MSRSPLTSLDVLAAVRRAVARIRPSDATTRPEPPDLKAMGGQVTAGILTENEARERFFPDSRCRGPILSNWETLSFLRESDRARIKAMEAHEAEQAAAAADPNHPPLERLQHARAAEDWQREDGPVLWWRPPVAEPPYAGTPNDDDWPGYHSHWTPIYCPKTFAPPAVSDFMP